MSKNMIFLFFFHLLVLLVASQNCGDQDFVIASNGDVVFTGNDNGVAVAKPFIVNADSTAPPALAAGDSVLVHGGLRLAQGTTATRPRCQAKNQGMMFLEQLPDTKDRVWMCSKLEGPAARFRWKEVKYSGGLGATNGPEVVDDFGATWDGYTRTAATWLTASTTCSNAGGRLPTVMELLRNVQVAGSGPISNYQGASSVMWSSTPDDLITVYYTVRLSDGLLGTSAPSAVLRYRCIWPYNPTNPFIGTNCYGTSTANCQSGAQFYNVDYLPRFSTTFGTAAYECRQSGGTLPTLKHVQNFAVTGVTFPSTSIQLNEFSAAGRLVASVTGFSSSWVLNNGYSTGATASPYVCMGKKPEVPAFYSTSQLCNGACQLFSTGVGAPIVVDTQHRPAATWQDAFLACRSVGGTLPDWATVGDLMGANWIVNDTTALWTSKMDVSVTLGFMGTFQGVASGLWSLSGATIGSLVWNATTPYRCVWPSTVLGNAFPSCTSGNSATWSTTYNVSCVASTTANVNGLQNPNSTSPFVDSYGYSWDPESRSAATFTVAKANCEALGARLPTAGEIYRVSTLQNPTGTNIVLPGNEPNIPLWTLFTDAQAAARVTMTQSGIPSSSPDTSPQKYRCVWPRAPFGNVFETHKCFGAPTDVDFCFRYGRYIFDKYDRPVVTAEVAAQECQFLGGRLPTLVELYDLIINGAPHGYNGFPFGSSSAPAAYGLWVLEAAPASRYLAVRWSGTGSVSYILNYGASWTDNSVTVSGGAQRNSYRCLFTDSL